MDLNKSTKKIDRRIFNGGARPGAGRPISFERQMFMKHALEKIVVKELRHGQIRKVKKTRLTIMIETLFRIGMTGGRDGKGNYRAINRWLDYAVGKPETPKSERSNNHGDNSPVKQKAGDKFYKVLEMAYGKDWAKEKLAELESKFNKPDTSVHSIDETKIKKPWEIAEENAREARKELNDKIYRQDEANCEAIERHFRERKRYDEMRRRDGLAR